ncbi:MAG: helix-turn-helix domain-containing protein [Bacteroidetes bacterium]|nr:helix-turn-helix domain-containing protein [Bacteroidota bacterium]
MPQISSRENDFLKRTTAFVEENMSNEQFGVSELAVKVGMSRSNLLRKVKKLTNLSVSQFIRQVRLGRSMEMLREQSFNVSEVSYKVGFSSTSYFIKCFHDHFGYPPGEVGKREAVDEDPAEDNPTGDKQAGGVPARGGRPDRKRQILMLAAAVLILAAVVQLVFIRPGLSRANEGDKSIAVLPFKNDSNDSSNVYLVNGLMESILGNLQKIEDLRVISRTSVEKYRDTDRTIPEIGRELNVSYFVEGSGQKIGDRILLNIQLIEAGTDRHLWAEQYERNAKDIFSLQREISRNIAEHIEAIITPEEEERISKVPTNDLEAYDLFLKGLDLLHSGKGEGVVASIGLFHRAIEQDHEFARAHAGIAIAYYFLDALQVEKKFIDSIGFYADQALLFDALLPQSLIAKSLFYINKREYELALPYLEKALEYNPNSALVINLLSDFYTSYTPDTKKYLEYALKGITLDIASQDSTEASFIYLHVSNALIQSGFVKEAERYISKSLEYDPDNLFTEQVRAYISYAENRDLGQTLEILIRALKRDSTRLDIVQEVGKIYYYMRDYERAYLYYKPFMEIREALNMGIYRSENGKIGVVLSELGLEIESEKLMEDYRKYAENDQSIYRYLSLAMYHSFKGDAVNAIKQLRLFSQEENYNYWTVLFLEIDPLVDQMKEVPEFQEILSEIESKFQDYHREIRASLEEKNLL